MEQRSPRQKKKEVEGEGFGRKRIFEKRTKDRMK